jgi:CRP-like cAMP-binding protein
MAHENAAAALRRARAASCDEDCGLSHIAGVCVRVAAKDIGTCLREPRYRRDPRLKSQRTQLLPVDMTAIRLGSLFTGLDDETLSRVAAEGRVRSLYRGEVVCRQGDKASNLYIVLDGWLKIHRTSAAGRSTVRSVVTRGDSFAEHAVFAQDTYSTTAEAVSDARVLELSGRSILDGFVDSPALATVVVRALSQRVETNFIELEQAYRTTAPQRLAGFLATMFASDAKHVDTRLAYDKNVLAARLGMMPESLSRAFLALSELGVKTHNRCVYIEDIARLRAYAEMEDA